MDQRRRPGLVGRVPLKRRSTTGSPVSRTLCRACWSRSASGRGSRSRTPSPRRSAGATPSPSADHAGPVEQDEAGGGLAEDGLGGGQIGLDPPELAQVHGHADDAAAPVLALGRHQVELGDALGAVAVAVGGGADPLLPGEDLGHPLPAAPPELAGREGGDGVTADGLLGGDVEELGGAVAPLADPPVRADGEGRDPYVVVDGAGLAVTPLRGRRLVHGVAHSFVTSVGIGRG
jgi:hypothetical protein